MLSSCYLIENAKVVRNKNRRIMLLSRCAMCNSKKLKFLKKQEAGGLLSNLLGIKLLILNDMPIVKILF